jgi:hypothetical protein
MLLGLPSDGPTLVVVQCGRSGSGGAAASSSTRPMLSRRAGLCAKVIHMRTALRCHRSAASPAHHYCGPFACEPATLTTHRLCPRHIPSLSTNSDCIEGHYNRYGGSGTSCICRQYSRRWAGSRPDGSRDIFGRRGHNIASVTTTSIAKPHICAARMSVASNRAGKAVSTETILLLNQLCCRRH